MGMPLAHKRLRLCAIAPVFEGEFLMTRIAALKKRGFAPVTAQGQARGVCTGRELEGSVRAVAPGSVAETPVAALRPQDAVPGSRRQSRLLAFEARMVWSVAKKRLCGPAVPGNPHEHRGRKAG